MTRLPPVHSLTQKLLMPTLLGLLGLFWLACSVSEAQAANTSSSITNVSPETKPTAQEIINAISQTQSAVVGIHSIAIDGARSIETLGKKRTGSGVIIDDSGLILTIGYLILEAQSIEITTVDQKTWPAQAVAYDLATGFGLIRPLLPLRGIRPVVLGISSNLTTGQALMASSGASAADEADVNMTQLVSRRPFSGYWEYHIDSALFTSPPVENHSGAPLFNHKGELLGVGSLFVMDAVGQNLRLPGNMFVPVDLLKPIMQELVQTGTSKSSQRPWIGLTSAEQSGRVQIMRVNPDSPAQAAGLQAGDVVLAVDDAKVATLEDFYKKIWNRPTPDTEIKLTVLQGADIKTILIKAINRSTTLRQASGI